MEININEMKEYAERQAEKSGKKYQIVYSQTSGYQFFLARQKCPELLEPVYITEAGKL